jgi:hypothetical protein
MKKLMLWLLTCLSVAAQGPTYHGTFIGNGAGLTNLPPGGGGLTNGQLGTVNFQGPFNVTNTSSFSGGVVATGIGFWGNGFGLTNLNATNLTGTIPGTSLPSNVLTNGQLGPILVNLTTSNVLSQGVPDQTRDVDGMHLYSAMPRPLIDYDSYGNAGTNVTQLLITNQIMNGSQQMYRAGNTSLPVITFIIDDGVFTNQDSNGLLQVNGNLFPSGIGYLAHFAHTNGQKLGIYTELNTNTSGGCRGIGLGYSNANLGQFPRQAILQSNAQMFASWGIDLVKVQPDDTGLVSGTQAANDLETFCYWLNYYSLVNAHPIAIMSAQGNSGEVLDPNLNKFINVFYPDVSAITGGISISDTGNFQGMWDKFVLWHQGQGLLGPGQCFYGMDNMGGGGGEFQQAAMTFCAMGPFSVDFADFEPYSAYIWNNPDVISVQQDPGWNHPFLVPQYSYITNGWTNSGILGTTNLFSTNQVWARQLNQYATPSVALACFNSDQNADPFTFSLQGIGLPGVPSYVYDCWGQSNIAIISNQSLTVMVGATNCGLYVIENEPGLLAQNASGITGYASGGIITMPLPNELMHFTLDEADGYVFHGPSGNGYVATNYFGSNWVKGVLGYGYSSGLFSDSIILAKPFTFYPQLTNGFTATMWFESTSVPNGFSPINLAQEFTGGTTLNFILYITNSSVISGSLAHVNGGATNTLHVAYACSNLCDGNWHFLGMAYNNSSLSITVDSNVVGTTSAGGPVPNTLAEFVWLQTGFVASVDDLRVFSSGLTAAQIGVIYTNALIQNVPGLQVNGSQLVNTNVNVQGNLTVGTNASLTNANSTLTLAGTLSTGAGTNITQAMMGILYSNTLHQNTATPPTLSLDLGAGSAVTIPGGSIGFPYGLPSCDAWGSVSITNGSGAGTNAGGFNIYWTNTFAHAYVTPPMVNLIYSIASTSGGTENLTRLNPTLMYCNVTTTNFTVLQNGSASIATMSSGHYGVVGYTVTGY